jgi:hypothetical protein
VLAALGALSTGSGHPCASTILFATVCTEVIVGAHSQQCEPNSVLGYIVARMLTKVIVDHIVTMTLGHIISTTALDTIV